MSTTTKAIVFAVVLLAAAGVTARSLLVRAAPETSTDSSADTSDVSQPSRAPDSPVTLGKFLADADAVFILLAGDDDSAAGSASGRVKDALKQIEPSQGKATLLSLAKDSDDYARLVKDHSITSFPSVIVVGKACEPELIPPDDITEARLLGAFLVASDPSLCESGCTPSSDCGS